LGSNNSTRIELHYSLVSESERYGLYTPLNTNMLDKYRTIVVARKAEEKRQLELIQSQQINIPVSVPSDNIEAIQVD